MMQFLAAHPWIYIVATFLFNNVVTALVSNLPAPTKDSTAKYVYWFKVSNTIVGNVKRANSTAVEASPNFLAAVDAHLAKLEEQKTWQPNGQPKP